MYNYLIDHNKEFIYYVTPKCASRTFFDIFNFKGGEERPLSLKHEEYFSWTFVRNPYARVVSAYQNKVVDKFQSGLDEFRHLTSFKDFVQAISEIDINKADRHIRPMNTFFPESISYVGKLENLNCDFDFICDKINLPKVNLPHLNKSLSKDYTEYYNTETQSIVKKIYSKDLDLFKYSYGD